MLKIVVSKRGKVMGEKFNIQQLQSACFSVYEIAYQQNGKKQTNKQTLFFQIYFIISSNLKDKLQQNKHNIKIIFPFSMSHANMAEL